jgi:hemolysin III
MSSTLSLRWTIPKEEKYSALMHHGERLNSVTHLIGGLVTLVGLVLLLSSAWSSGSPWNLVGCAIYGAAMLSMFSISTLYHSARGTRKALFRKLDHVAIYGMIAGSYTPFCLSPLRNGIGWWLLGAVWGLALLGAILEFQLSHRSRLPSIALYFAMALLAFAAFPGLEQTLPANAVLWIKGGDYLFLTGFVFYVLDKKFRGRHLHGIWHVFVIGGAFCQFVSVYAYLLPSSA